MILGYININEDYWEEDITNPPYFSPLNYTRKSVSVEYLPPIKKEKNG